MRAKQVSLLQPTDESNSFEIEHSGFKVKVSINIQLVNDGVKLDDPPGSLLLVYSIKQQLKCADKRLSLWIHLQNLLQCELLF